MARRSRRDPSSRWCSGTRVLASLQLALAATAWIDLARRPADQVNGSKVRWAAVIAINFVGPILYFTKGRKAR